jgi:hypothetical protein
MCTVSFVRCGDKTILTSNRDEEVLRPAIPPKNYRVNGKNLVFPKDPRAGGTWFAVAENANVLVLLNGAAQKHHWEPPYRKSRGLVVLDLISNESPLQTWEKIDLDKIEPFTLVLYEQAKLFQLRWDGVQKETTALAVTRNYVWSSSTLYPEAVREQRSVGFIISETKPQVTETEMFDFHRYTENDDQQHGLVINRDDKLKTLSITQVVLERNKVALVHHDLLDHQKSEQTFTIV